MGSQGAMPEEKEMYVSIDMDNLVFLHKHANHEALSALSWMEIGVHRTTIITGVDKARFVKTLSELEIKMLYKNTTRAELSGDDLVTLRYQLSVAAEMMPCTRAVTQEILTQAALVDDRVHEGETFKYAPGAKQPAQPQELFPIKGKPLTKKQLSDAAEWARSDLPKMTERMSPGPWPKERSESAQSESKADPDAPPPPKERKKTRSRTPVKPVIFAAANKAWQDAGEPRDEESLKQISSALLPELTNEKGMHPTTCRIKLSEWRKELLAGG